MTVNNSSILSVKYFESYFNLVISSRGYNLEEAKAYMIQNFFKGDLKLYGEDTYQSFISASLILQKEKNPKI